MQITARITFIHKLTIVTILWLQPAKESSTDLDILVFWMQWFLKGFSRCHAKREKPISWYFGGWLIFEFLSRLSRNWYIKIEKILKTGTQIWLECGRAYIINVIIETASKIINKQGKSAMLDFFADFSDLCQLTVATSRHTMYIS